ncbi:hypothetical protein ACOME3_009294 [Neoechinorhynchus agilis]
MNYVRRFKGLIWNNAMSIGLIVSIYIAACVNSSDRLNVDKNSNERGQRYTRPPMDLTVIENENATMHCELESPHGEVQWVKDNLAMGYERELHAFPTMKVQGDETKGQYNLFIQNAQLIDRGNYSCEVSPYRSYSHLKRTAFLNVISPPKFMSINASSNVQEMRSLDNNYMLKVNYDEEEIELDCTASGAFPESYIRWRVTNHGSALQEHYIAEMLKRQEQFRMRVESQYGNYWTYDVIGKLKLSVRKQLNGIHLACEAQHPALRGLILRSSVILTVLWPPTFVNVFSPPNEAKYAVAGKKYNVRCEVHGGNPTPRFEWTLNGDSLYGPRPGIRSDQEGVFIDDCSFVAKVGRNLTNLTCAVSNEYTTSSRSSLNQRNFHLNQTLSLETYYGPTSIRLIQSNYTNGINGGLISAVEGERLILACEASFVYPSASISWLLDGLNIMPVKESVTNGIEYFNLTSWIDILTSRSHNKKQLTCTAMNNVAQISRSMSAEINVIYGIDTIIINGYKRGHVLGVSKILVLVCHVKGGNPLPNVTWFANKGAIPSEYDITNDGIVSIMRKTLQQNDSGASYMCQASVQHMGHIKLKSASVKIKMHFGPTTIKLLGLKNIYEVDEVVNIVCESNLCNPKPVVALSIKRPVLGVLKLRTKPTITANDQTRVKGEGYFVKATAQHIISEFDHLSVVQCDISFPGSPLSISRTEKSHIIRVHHKPRFINDHNRFNITENENIVIKAEITAYPDNVFFRWLNPQMQEIRSEMRHNNRASAIAKGPLLFLHNVHRSMSGIYVCEANNSVGTSQQHFELNVFYVPNVEIMNDSLILIPKTPSTLTCQVDANPLSVNAISWFKNSINLPNKAPGHQVIFRDGQLLLKIYNTTEQDAGQYSCHAENALGTNFKSVSVHVKTPPRILKDPSNTKYAAESGKRLTAFIKCVVKAVPNVDISWTMADMNDQVEVLKMYIKNNSKYKTNQTTTNNFVHIATLAIDNFANSDQRSYLCIAENELGKDKAEIQLRALSPPDAPTNLRLLNKTFESISITWDPGFSGGKPQWFGIRCRERDSNVMIIVTTDEGAVSYTVKQLTPKTHYLIDIKAINELGQSNWVPEPEMRVETDGETFSVSGLTYFDTQSTSPRLPVLLVFMICTISACLLLFTVVIITCVVQRNKQSNNDLESTMTNTFETDPNTAEPDDATTPLFHESNMQGGSSPNSANYNTCDTSGRVRRDTTRHYNLYGRSLNAIIQGNTVNQFSQSSYDNLPYSTREIISKNEATKTNDSCSQVNSPLHAKDS